MKKILVCSDHAPLAERIAAFVQKCGYDNCVSCNIDGALKECGDADAAVFASSAPPASWSEAVRAVAERSGAGLVALVREGMETEAEEAFAETGVLVLPANVSSKIFTQALSFAVKCSERLRAVSRENSRLKETIGDLKLIDRAKCALIQYLNMTEADAHRFIEKSAMNRRVSRREIALEILKTYES